MSVSRESEESRNEETYLFRKLSQALVKKKKKLETLVYSENRSLNEEGKS